MSAGKDPQNQCAVFEIWEVAHPRKLGAEPPQRGIRQACLVIPLESDMGRDQLGQPRRHLAPLNAEQGGETRYCAPMLDYFENRVSRTHCKIELDDRGQVRVRNLGRSNQTRIVKASEGKVEPDTLKTQLSYRLDAEDRLILGEPAPDGPRYEYRYLGLQAQAVFVRLRCWLRDVPLEDAQYPGGARAGEWMTLTGTRSRWSSSELELSDGTPAHQGPPLEIQLSLVGNRPIASITRAGSHGADALHQVQTSGSQIYGAEPDLNGDTELHPSYCAYYEVLVPGHSPEITGMGDRRIAYLRPDQVQIEVVLLPNHQVSSINLGFCQVHLPRKERQAMSFKAGKSTRIYEWTDVAQPLPDHILAPRPKELQEPNRKAKDPAFRASIVVAMVKKRLEDEAQAIDTSNLGWIGWEHVLAMGAVGQAYSAEKFRKHRNRLKPDLDALLQDTFRYLVGQEGQDHRIPAEEDWNALVEVKDQPPCIRFRPEVKLRFVRAHLKETQQNPVQRSAPSDSQGLRQASSPNASSDVTHTI